MKVYPCPAIFSLPIGDWPCAFFRDLQRVWPDRAFDRQSTCGVERAWKVGFGWDEHKEDWEQRDGELELLVDISIYSFKLPRNHVHFYSLWNHVALESIAIHRTAIVAWHQIVLHYPMQRTLLRCSDYIDIDGGREREREGVIHDSL